MLSVISRSLAKLLTCPGHLRRFKEGTVLAAIFLLLRIIL